MSETSEKDQVKIFPEGYTPSMDVKYDSKERNSLLNAILEASPKDVEINTDIFHVMKKRRSTRRFSSRHVEASKVDEILAAADTAPTAGNFQGFEIFYVKDPKKKEQLIEACNKQPYANAPIVLVYCKNPARVKLDFPERILKKFAIQDATLAAAYSQLAAQALGLSSIWIGMFDEQKVMEIIGTDLVPSSLLCIGYPEQKKIPKSRRNLKELIHVV